jgi:hypothetical protein
MEDWEQHTTGFGRKILSKFGFKEGSGLGKYENGRRIPIQPVVKNDRAGIGSSFRTQKYIEKSKKRKKEANISATDEITEEMEEVTIEKLEEKTVKEEEEVVEESVSAETLQFWKEMWEKMTREQFECIF